MHESRIYIIDDNEAVCQSLKFLFTSFYNNNVAIYHNPLLFLEEFSADWRGCLIIDLDMPAMNGIDLSKELIRRNNKMKSIIMSGHGSTDAEQQALDAGVYAFITKPFKTEYLLEQVKTMLQLNAQ